MLNFLGNISNTNLVEAIEKPSFKKYWNITEDKFISVKTVNSETYAKNAGPM
jgi:hypothetical protein